MQIFDRILNKYRYRQQSCMYMNILDHTQTYLDPHLLTGEARIAEIGRLLAAGILRMRTRQRTYIQQGFVSELTQYKKINALNDKKL
jgi:hypothetical protein